MMQDDQNKKLHNDVLRCDILQPPHNHSTPENHSGKKDNR